MQLTPLTAVRTTAVVAARAALAALVIYTPIHLKGVLDTATHGRAAAMVVPILSHTPQWVWGLLAALIAVGLTQARDRTAGIARVTALPVGMGVLSLWSTAAAFGSSPQFALVAATWLACAAAAFAAVASMAPEGGSQFDAATRQFTMPGSWWPLALILSLFALRYGINVALALQPGLAADASFPLWAGAAYGGFTGIFSGRAARLLRLARQPGPGFAPILST